jgi:hypothetical protein
LHQPRISTTRWRSDNFLSNPSDVRHRDDPRRLVRRGLVMPLGLLFARTFAKHFHICGFVDNLPAAPHAPC